MVFSTTVEWHEFSFITFGKRIHQDAKYSNTYLI